MNYLNLACKHYRVHIEDVDGMHTEWQLDESHQLLRTITWHVRQPFSQTSDFAETETLDRRYYLQEHYCC